MDKKMAISVLVRLVDQITGPLNRIMAKVQALGGMGRRIGDLTRHIGDLSNKIGALGALGAGLSFAGPLKAAADLEAVVRDIGITAEMSGAKLDGWVISTMAGYERLGAATRNSAIKIAGAAQSLVQAGMPNAMIEKFLPIIARVATSQKAEILDIAKTAFAMWNNLGVGPENLERGLAMLAKAGKLGRFELRSMAKEFPEWTAKIAPFVKELEAVATLGTAGQIAMFGVDSPDEASTTVTNTLAHLTDPSTIKHFKEKFNTDIMGTMVGAITYGMNPIESAFQKILSVTEISAAKIKEEYDRALAFGVGPKKALEEVTDKIRDIYRMKGLTDITPDVRVLRFLAAFALHVKDYKNIKGEVSGAATGIIAEDYASREKSLELQIQHFIGTAERATRRIGMAFAKHLPWMSSLLDDVIARVKTFDKQNPGMIDRMLVWGGAALLVTAALGILGPSVLAVTAGTTALVTVVKGITLGIALLSRTFVALGIAMMTTPVGWIIAGAVAIAGAAYLIYRNWEPIKGFFVDLWTSIENTISAAAGRIKGWWDELIPEWVRPYIRGAAAAIPGGALISAGASAASLAGIGSGPAGQKQEVGGKIVVRVEGPGKVESVTSDNRAVPIEVDRGLMLGMP
jgi:hypothetical protein